MSAEASPLLTNHAAAEQGISKNRLAGPRFQTVLTGVHAPVGVVPDLQLRCDAALLVMPVEAVFSHWTAVAILGGPVMNGPPWLEASVPSLTLRPRRKDVRAHRRVLQTSEVMRRAGYPLTTPTRTFIDLAEKAPLPDLVAVGDWFVRTGLTSAASLHQAIALAGGKRGVVRARRAASLLNGNAGSPPESLLRMRILDAGLPMPDVNVPVFDADGGYIATPDLSYREARIAIEYEGAHHRGIDQFRRDTVRDQLLAGLGWTVLRATSRDYRPGSSTLLDSISALLAAKR